ncbi:MAG TPA: hypothetical protein PKI68_01705 [Pontiellaceae bacterium]|nr:hypothetical protein [Pontiellaceae bacterium]
MRSEQLKKAVIPALILGGGLFLRLFRLGTASLQIDNFLFWDLFHREVSAGGIFAHWMELTGVTGQLPFAAAAAKLFIDILHLPLSFGTMILPFALCGALAIPVAYMAGREFGGPRMAALLAAMVAFSPICIQMSREAYFYTPALLGAFLALWAAGLSGRMLRDKPVPRGFHIVNAAAFLVMTWSSPSTWPYAFFFALFNVALFGWQLIRHRRGMSDVLIVLVTYLVIGLPLLLAPWGLEQIKQFTSDGATRDYWTKVFAAGRGVSQWDKIWPVFSSYAWGITPVRQIFSALIVFSGLYACIAGFRKNRTFAVLGLIFVAVLMLNVLALEKSVWIFGMTRVVPLVPFYLLFLSAGLLYPFEKLRGKRGGVLTVLVPVIGFGLWIEPVSLIPSLTGIPRPYAEIAAWADQHLPEDTPVLTERFFTAYNEFRVHAPKKVQFISTVPNQIPEQYNGLEFRKRTLQFFKDNPGSAFYEEKHLWDRAETGPWPEVRELFARSHTVTNRAGMRLAQLGLFDQGDPSVPYSPEPFTSTIYYNLPEDVAARARTEGPAAVILFSKGWKTVSTRDYRTWRLLQSAAVLEAWNLTDAPQKAAVVLHGVAAGGAKQVELVGGAQKIFPNGQLTDWTLGSVTLAPGKNLLMLRDPLPGNAVPLLVSSVEIRTLPF